MYTDPTPAWLYCRAPFRRGASAALALPHVRTVGVERPEAREKHGDKQGPLDRHSRSSLRLSDRPGVAAQGQGEETEEGQVIIPARYAP